MIKQVLWDTSVRAFRRASRLKLVDFFLAFMVMAVLFAFTGFVYNIPFIVVAYLCFLVIVYTLRRIFNVFQAIYRLKKASDRIMNSTGRALDKDIKK